MQFPSDPGPGAHGLVGGRDESAYPPRFEPAVILREKGFDGRPGDGRRGLVRDDAVRRRVVDEDAAGEERSTCPRMPDSSRCSSSAGGGSGTAAISPTSPGLSATATRRLARSSRTTPPSCFTITQARSRFLDGGGDSGSASSRYSIFQPPLPPSDFHARSRPRRDFPPSPAWPSGSRARLRRCRG